MVSYVWIAYAVIAFTFQSDWKSAVVQYLKPADGGINIYETNVPSAVWWRFVLFHHSIHYFIRILIHFRRQVGT